MSDTGTVIAVVSTLISSVALVGVAIGLLLQLRQVRIGQLQTVRSMQAELVRMGLENAELVADPMDPWHPEPEKMRRYILINWEMKHLEMCYTVGVISEASARLHLAALFQVPFRCEWWTKAARDVYRVDAGSRRERKFFAIADDECRQAVGRETPSDEHDMKRNA
jgi:hypothetical protein